MTRACWIAVGLTVVASARIAATYSVFNHTFDEPAHIACGMEWVERGSYTYEPQHPPLARVAAAIGPFLVGARSQGKPAANDMVAVATEGARILYAGHDYDEYLSAARAGILPFFWIACAVVFVWGRKVHGDAGGALAVFFLSFLPPVLAHAGLATTDMALTALLGAAFVAGWRWWEQPTIRRAAVFGAATGLMTLAKFTGLAFFPVAAGIGLWLLRGEKKQGPRLKSFGVAVGVGAILIAVVYRFSFGAIGAGIAAAFAHEAQGHPSYLLGSTSTSGFWSFYPVALAVKTPLALLAILGFTRWRKDRMALAFAGGILAVAVFSRINIGVRHVLPVYLAFSVMAAGAVLHLWPRWRWAVLVAGLWFAGSSVASHPDYLAYFNELAGGHPEKILVESDLDWGQDMKRLSARLREVGARQVVFDPFVLADYEGELGFPRVAPSNPAGPSVGWNAVSITMWKTRHVPAWPDRAPEGERVGKGVMLWEFRAR